MLILKLGLFSLAIHRKGVTSLGEKSRHTSRAYDLHLRRGRDLVCPTPCRLPYGLDCPLSLVGNAAASGDTIGVVLAVCGTSPSARAAAFERAIDKNPGGAPTACIQVQEEDASRLCD